MITSFLAAFSRHQDGSFLLQLADLAEQFSPASSQLGRLMI
jgi:hypothetical protein